jgi:hypothetical protein
MHSDLPGALDMVKSYVNGCSSTLPCWILLKAYRPSIGGGALTNRLREIVDKYNK